MVMDVDEVVARIQPALQKLLFARHISLDAYFLGMQLCQRFKEFRSLRVVMTHREATSSYVMDGCRVVAGRVAPDMPHFVEAMQGLHFCAGLVSHYIQAELDKPDAYTGHFTLNPSISMGVDVTSDTPIGFKFDPEDLKLLEGHAEACVSDDLHSKFTARNFVKN